MIWVRCWCELSTAKKRTIEKGSDKKESDTGVESRRSLCLSVSVGHFFYGVTLPQYNVEDGSWRDTPRNCDASSALHFSRPTSPPLFFLRLPLVFLSLFPQPLAVYFVHFLALAGLVLLLGPQNKEKKSTMVRKNQHGHGNPPMTDCAGLQVRWPAWICHHSHISRHLNPPMTAHDVTLSFSALSSHSKKAPCFFFTGPFCACSAA